ncbi:MAG: ribosome silencing factor [Nitrosospira sp.]|nr:ribosome silencing factor [Nitrosospira sp.]
MTLVKLVKTVVDALEEIKARDIDVLDVRKITTLFDRMIIASGDSNRHTKAIANNVAEKVKAAGGTVYGMEGEGTGEWILVDLGDVLVHVMQVAARAHYNLEELWAGARNIKRMSASSVNGESRAKSSISVNGEAAARTDSGVKKKKVSKPEAGKDGGD